MKPAPLLELWLANQLVGALFEREFARLGLRPPYFALLSLLKVDGPATPTSLATTTGIAPTTLRTILNELADKGLIRRRPHPTDGRSFVVELSPKGLQTQLLGVPAVLALEEALGVGSSGQRSGLTDQLRALRRAAEAELATPAREHAEAAR